MKFPKLLENTFALYPPIQALLIAHDLIQFTHSQNIFSFSRLVFSSYLLSPLIWWFLKTIFGRETDGAHRIGWLAKTGNAWVAYYQLQLVYTHFSFFERFLRLFPGLYSVWLRMWGSKIGKRVFWTAEMQVVDRGHLVVGDRVFFGNRCYISAHAMKRIKNKLLLYVKKVTIGEGAMISYLVHLSPGVVIGKRAHIEAGAALYPNDKVSDDETYAKQ